MTHREFMRTLVIFLIRCGTTLSQQRKVYERTWESIEYRR